MQVTSQLKEQDYATYTRTMYKGKIWQIVLMILGSIALSALAGTLTEALRSILVSIFGKPGQPWENFFLVLYFLVFFAIVFGLMAFFLPFLTKGHINPDGHFLAATQFTLLPEGFTIQTRYTQGQVEWRGVQRIAVMNDLLLIYVDTMIAYIIPKRCFASPEAAMAFYQQAQSYWQAARQQPVSQPPAPEGQA